MKKNQTHLFPSPWLGAVSWNESPPKALEVPFTICNNIIGIIISTRNPYCTRIPLMEKSLRVWTEQTEQYSEASVSASIATAFELHNWQYCH